MIHEFDRENWTVFFSSEDMKIYLAPKESSNSLREQINSFSNSSTIPISTMNTNRLKRLVLSLTDDCNLRCRYCYLGNGNKTNKPCHTEKMSEQTVLKSIEYAYELYPEGIDCIQFFGGEPLLNYKLIEFAVEKANAVAASRQLKSPLYTIVTNGTIMNDDIHELFNKYFSRVTISLDGSKESNDSFRIFENSNESVHDRVIQHLNHYKEHRKYKVDIQMTLTEAILNKFEDVPTDYLYIESLKAGNVHVSPLVDSSYFLTDENIDKVGLSHKYIKKCIEVDWNKIDQSNYMKVLSMASVLKNKRKSVYFCGAGINDMSISADGKVFPCFMFFNDAQYVMDDLNNPKPDQYKEIRDQLYLKNKITCIEKCDSCWAKYICSSGHSGCIGAFYHENGRIDQPIDSNCHLSRSIFEDVLFKIAKYSKGV